MIFIAFNVYSSTFYKFSLHFYILSVLHNFSLSFQIFLILSSVSQIFYQCSLHFYVMHINFNVFSTFLCNAYKFQCFLLNTL